MELFIWLVMWSHHIQGGHQIYPQCYKPIICLCQRLSLPRNTLKNFDPRYPTPPTNDKTRSQKKSSSCQPANQHTQLWSYVTHAPQPPLIGPLLPRYSAVRLGHSQAREESGVNGTRKTLFPKMYLFLNNLTWRGVLLKSWGLSVSLIYLN